MRHRKTPPPIDTGANGEKNPYEILGISPGAGPAEIRKAYLKKLRHSPPEKDPEGFKTVKQAYTRLQDSGQRKAVELSLFKTESGIVLPSPAAAGLSHYFKDRILRFFLASSDFYMEDFTGHFFDISGEIKKLK